MQRLLQWVALSLSLAVICGCATTTNAPGQVARDWSCKLREMQIRPIFPPREDVQVGDVYWLDQMGATDADGYCGEKKDFLQIAPYVAYLDVRNGVSSHYGARPNFPKTTSSQGTVTLTASGLSISQATQSTDATQGDDGLFTNGKADRTRVAAFPDFMTVHVDKTSIGAILPVQGILASLGLGSQNLDEATISIPVAESYSVPTAVFSTALASNSGGTKSLCDAARFLTPSLKNRTGYFHIVNEVFYTRAIDVTISGQSELTASAGANLPTSVVSSTGPAAITTTGIITQSTVAGSVTQSITAVSDGMLKQFQARNNLPGVSVAYEQGNARRVSMRRIFDRPVAIGFRSIPILIWDDCTFDTPEAAGGTNIGKLSAPVGGPGMGSSALAQATTSTPSSTAASAASNPSGTASANVPAVPALPAASGAKVKHALGGQQTGNPWGGTNPARVANDR